MLSRKLIINAAVICVCAIIAISIPVIVDHLQKPKYQAEALYQLVSIPVNDNIHDALVWQLKLYTNHQTVENWDEIYQAIQKDTALIQYNQEYLQLREYGIVYHQNQTTSQCDFPLVVTYKGYTCQLNITASVN